MPPKSGPGCRVPRAEVRRSPAHVRDARSPKCPKCPGEGPWQSKRLQRSPSPRARRDSLRETGEEKGPFEGAATQPPFPARCPHPLPLPSVPGGRARLHLPGAQSTPSFFKTTLRTALRSRTGRDTGLRPARPEPGRARERAPRRRRSPAPAARGWGGRWRPGPAPRLHRARERPGVTGGARAARAGSRAPRRGDSPGCALAAGASSGWDFSSRCSRRGCKRPSSSWCPWPRFP